MPLRRLGSPVCAGTKLYRVIAFFGLVRHGLERAGMFSVELYGRVRHACHVEGLSQREAARRFGIHRNTVRKMLAFSVPPGYRRVTPPRRPKLGAVTAIIDQILAADRLHWWRSPSCSASGLGAPAGPDLATQRAQLPCGPFDDIAHD